MNSDRKYNGDINAGELGADLMGFYIGSESKRIYDNSKRAIDEGIELIVDIRQERKSQRYLKHVMGLPV
ncbi:MAG: hypothetical protein AABW91_03975 [Nanoarchaeota archaeon]